MHPACRVTITAGGADPDMPSLVRRYDFEDNDMLAASMDGIRNMLDNNRRININDTLLLYSGYTRVMAAGGLDARGIREGLAGLLADYQVMIGIPEMTRRVEIRIEKAGGGGEGGSGGGGEILHLLVEGPIRSLASPPRGGSGIGGGGGGTGGAVAA